MHATDELAVIACMHAFCMCIGRSVTVKQVLPHIHDTIMKVYVVMDMMDTIAQVHKLA